MADNQIDISVELKNAVDLGRASMTKLKDSGAFEGVKGGKDLTRIQNLIESLSKVDLNNLSGKELTKFLNDLNKLGSLLEKATTGLNNYTEAYKKQLDIVADARKALDEAKDKRTTALERRKTASENLKLDENKFLNKKTGRQISNPDTIAKAYSSGDLEIQGPRGGVIKDQESKAAALGIKEYAAAVTDVENATIAVDNATVAVDTAENTLAKIPKGDQVHPITNEVLDSAQNMRKITTNVRTQADTETEAKTKANLDKLAVDSVNFKEQTSSLGKAFKAFSIYTIAIKAAKTALREAVQTVKELDKYLTEQAMVTGLSRDQTYKLVGAYQDLAMQCGATTKEIAQVATEYMKQGKTIADTMTLTEAAVKAAKVARVSVGDSVNYLTTALNGFRLSADQAMAVSDKFAAVAAASATDYDELAIALSKVASQANLAGMSIDYTTALLTKGLETTREAPETMGTALKTIIARMRELSDYGETLGGDTDINKVESQLAYVGIALRDTSGELRSTEEVLDELGHKWDDLNKNQQAAIAKALAGTRQQSRLIAMMDDYERVTELQQISSRSAGATAAQASTYLEGMEGATNRIRVAWEKLVMNLTNSKLIIGTFNLVGKVLNNIAGLMGNLETQIPIFTILGALALSALGNKMKEMQLAKEQAALEREIAIQEQQNKINEMKANEAKWVAEAVATAKKVQKQNELAALRDLEIADNKFIAAQKDEEIQKAIVEKQAKLVGTLKEITALKEQDEVKEDLLVTEAQISAELAEQRSLKEDATEADKIAAERAKEDAKNIEKKNKLNDQDRKKYNEKLKIAEKQLAKDRKNLKLAEQRTKEAEKEKKQAAEKVELVKAQKKSDEQLKAEAKQQFQESIEHQEKLLGYMQQQGTAMGFLNGLGNVFLGILKGIAGAFALIGSIIKINNILKQKGIDLTKKEGRETARNLIKQKISAAWQMAKSAAWIPYVGWGIAAGIIATLIGVAIAGAVGAFNVHEKDAGDDIKQLSAEIYKLEESAQALDTTADHFENLDKKILKTKEDIQSMNEDLEKIGETMSEEDPNDGKNDTEYDKDISKITGGKSEAEYYEGLTDKEKIEFARQKAELQRQEADRKRDKQIEVMQSIGYTVENGRYISAEEHQRHLLETDKEVRDAFYAYNKNQLYDYIDALKEGSETMAAISEEEAIMLEGVTQNLLDNMDAWDAYQYAQNPEKVRELADTLRSVQVNGKQALEVLQGINDDEDTEISLKEKVAAYNALKDSLDETTRAAFMMEYQEFEFWSTLSDKALDLLDNINLSNDAINDIYSAYDKLNKILEDDLGKTAAQLDADTYKTMIDSVWDSLDEDFSNFEDVLKSTFGSIIGDSEDAWNALVSSIGDEIATTILDMGQEMEAFGNTINSFYEKASEWNEFKESEKMEFIADNSELFSGEGGAALLEAFESGNYNAIEEALGAQMAEKQEQQLQQIRRTLAIEEARVGEDRNEAYIAALKQYEQHLMDTNNLYKASLDLRLEQEEAQIEKYKEYLEEQQEALTESLEKRKEAYEKYFEAINQEQDDEDYEEEATRLIDNITKLSSSTNADAMQQTAELQQELENLEEERLQELRERAQEAVIENIDTTIEEINDKFDKLLDSNQALLLAMQGELDNPLEFMTDMIVSQAGKGTTALELEQYLQDLQGTYGNIIGNDVFENMSVREENGQLILNIRGEEITLTQGDEQSIFTAVMDALRAVGLK